MVSPLILAAVGVIGCGESEKSAERPKDVGYVAPELPKADAKAAGDAKAPAK
jgi:hypothetical protein